MNPTGKRGEWHERRKGRAGGVGAKSFERELAEEIRQEKRQAALYQHPSTSVIPVRCGAPSCQEWNDRSREKCKWCGSPLR